MKQMSGQSFCLREGVFGLSRGCTDLLADGKKHIAETWREKDVMDMVWIAPPKLSLKFICHGEGIKKWDY